VLGNPPYVRAEHQSAAFKAYAAEHYAAAAGSADLYVYFMEHGVRLLREGGVYGVIAANKWLRAGYGEKLRAFLRPHVSEIIDFGDLPVFADAVTYPAIVIADKTPSAAPTVAVTQVESLEYSDLGEYVRSRRHATPRAGLGKGSWSLAQADDAALLDQMRAVGVPLSEYIQPAQIRRGVVTGLNEAFIIGSGRRKALIAADPACAPLIKLFLTGADVKPYQFEHHDKYLIFIRRGMNIEQYPSILDHLLQYRKRLEPRPAGHNGEWGGRKAGSYQWYELQDPIDYYLEFEQPKIIYPDIAPRCSFALDTDDRCYMNNTTYFFNSSDRYLLGVLNSAVVTLYASKSFANYRGGYIRFFQDYVKTIPIPRAAPDDPRRLRIVELVTEMLALKRRAADPLMSMRDGDLNAQMREIDAAIDRQVRALYGL
jgi:hypothetical protein